MQAVRAARGRRAVIRPALLGALAHRMTGPGGEGFALAPRKGVDDQCVQSAYRMRS